jgi:HEAT repeat protein
MGDVAVPALVSLAANADLNIRTSAIRSLAGPTDRFDEILPTLLRALQDARKRLKDDAIYALGRIKRSSPEVIAELTRIAEQDSDSQTREAAKSLLKELRPR